MRYLSVVSILATGDAGQSCPFKEKHFTVPGPPADQGTVDRWLQSITLPF